MDVEPDVRFEFVLVLKGDPRGIQRLPDYFAEYVAGDVLGKVVRQPLDAAWVALEDEDELEPHVRLHVHLRR